MEYIILSIKGFLIGLAKIIPGVSGAMLAISLGLYEKAMIAISCFFEKPKEYSKFLISIGIGIFLAVVLGSKVILFFIASFYLPTMLLFIGLILGGIPMLFNKTVKQGFQMKNFVAFLLSFTTVICLPLIQIGQIEFSNFQGSFFLFFSMGLLEAATMVIPGISGTAIFMILGLYDTLLNLFGSFGTITGVVTHMKDAFPFGIGVVSGTIGIVFLMKYLFKNHHEITYAAITGFALSSLAVLFFQTLSQNYTILNIMIGLAFLVLGYKISRIIDTNES